jgi:hypothetical protein
MASPASGGSKAGRNLPLSLPRRIMCDLMAFSKGIPTVPVQRRMHLAGLAEARVRLTGSAGQPGWCALFTRAYGLMAARFPELRRAYLSFPRAHLYEHPASIASIAVERQYRGENAVFWGQVRGPERQPLAAIQAHLRRLKDDPVESISLFRRVLLLGRLPWPLRRAAWWIGLNCSGRQRAKRFGTFGVSVYSGLGAEGLHPISPLTSTLNYGPVQADGTVAVRIVYDHRVVDGAVVARALACLEGILNGEVLAEVRQQAGVRAA